MPIGKKGWNWFEPKLRAGSTGMRVAWAALLVVAAFCYAFFGPLVFDVAYWLLGKIARVQADRRLRAGVSIVFVVVYFVAVSLTGSTQPNSTGAGATSTPLVAMATASPSASPTASPSASPTASPSASPTVPSATPSITASPSVAPTPVPTAEPTPPPVSYATLTSRSWALLVKAPDNYLGNTYKVWGCISQFDAATGDDTFRAQASYRNLAEAYWYLDGVNAVFTGDATQLADYVETDVVQMNVIGLGSYTYATQIGGSTTVPLFEVNTIKRIGSC